MPRPARYCLTIAIIGCTTEIPPAEPNFEETRGAVTVYDIQDEAAENHPEVGERVRLRNLIVTAYDRFDEDGGGRVGTVFLQEIEGGPYSGIQLYRPDVLPAGAYVQAGDVVDAEGTYAEFEYGQIDPDSADPEGRTVTQLTEAVVRKTGEWQPPEPTHVDNPVDLFEDPAAESWEGVLIEISDVVVQEPPDSYAAYPVTGGVEIDNDLYTVPDVTVDLAFARVAGVISYFYAYHLLPRSSLDVELRME